MFRIPTVTDAELLTGKIQLQIDPGVSLNVEGDLCTVKPVGVPLAELSVAKGPAAVYNTGSIVLLPQVFEGLTLLRQRPVHLFRVKIPVNLGIDRAASLAVQALSDELICDILRKRIG